MDGLLFEDCANSEKSVAFLFLTLSIQNSLDSRRDPWLSRLGRGILVAFSLNDSTERAEIDRVSTAWEKASPLFELRFHRVKRPRFNARVAADKIRAPFYACLTRARFAPLRDSNQRIRIRFLLLLSIYNISRVRFEFTRYVTRGKISIFDPIRNDV